MLSPIIADLWTFMREISTSGDLKSGDSLFRSNSPTHPRLYQSTQSLNYIMGIDQAIKRVLIEVHRVLIHKGANFQPIRCTTQIWAVTRYQYGFLRSFL